MRVVYVQQHFAAGSGTAGVRGWNLVRAMVRRGHAVTVIAGHNWRDAGLASDPAGRVVEEATPDGYRLVKIPVYYSNHQSLGARAASFLRFGARACAEAARRPADLVYASSTPPTVSLPALWVRLRRRTPFVFEVRDLWPEFPAALGVVRSPLLLGAMRAWERHVYRRALRVVALAPGIRDAVVRAGGVPEERVLMVPNGSDTAGIRPLPGRPRVHLPVDNRRVVFGFTGTHGPANGLSAVLDAAAVLRRRGFDGARFVLVGDGREKSALRDRARREGLDSVLFLDLVGKDRYPALLSEIDVGLQVLRNVPAFRYATSPNKFFDYLAAGRPVLVNYPGWMADLVASHGCGRSVAPDDPDAFADAVEWFCGRDADRVSMGAAARRLAEREFAQERILDGLVRALEEAVGDPRAAGLPS